jgi:predicted nuclease of predicted toxin-antitoxin system
LPTYSLVPFTSVLLILGALPTRLFWEYAKAQAFAFLNKDKDFASLSLAWGAPPKVILLLTGNCFTWAIERIVRDNAVRLIYFEKDAKRSLLVLR